MIHSFLEQLASEKDLVPGLGWLMMAGLNPDGRVILMHLLLSFRVSAYSTQQCIFACLGNLPVEGLPSLVEIPDEDFAAQRSICTVPRVNRMTHLGGISPLDWQTNPCKRSAKSAGTEYVYLDFRVLTFVPPDCASWLLQREADVPLNVSGALIRLFPLLTGQEPPLEEALQCL